MIPNSWFCGGDVVEIARAMIGMEIFTETPEGIVSGIISETEAYAGAEDRASHAWNGRRTARTETMFQEGGTVYIYLCYGIHSLLNIVTNKRDIPHAVLIRAMKPVSGAELMLRRLQRDVFKPSDLYGPGNVAKALGMHFSDSGIKLGRSLPASPKKIWIEKAKTPIAPEEIAAGKRIGVDYAGFDALLPYRFTLINK